MPPRICSLLLNVAFLSTSNSPNSATFLATPDAVWLRSLMLRSLSSSLSLLLNSLVLYAEFRIAISRRARDIRPCRRAAIWRAPLYLPRSRSRCRLKCWASSRRSLLNRPLPDTTCPCPSGDEYLMLVGRANVADKGERPGVFATASDALGYRLR